MMKTDERDESTVSLIICIHEVTDKLSPTSPWSIPASELDQLLLSLQDAGWALRESADGTSRSLRRLQLTFDDARSGAIDWLLNSPTTSGLQAMVFPVTGFIDNPQSIPASELYSRFTSWELLKEVHEAGHIIASHSVSHRSLISLNIHELQKELLQSKIILEDLFGKVIEDLALPYGHYNKQVIVEARRQGYKRIYTTRPGLSDKSKIKQGLLPRYVIRSDRTDLAIDWNMIARSKECK